MKNWPTPILTCLLFALSQTETIAQVDIAPTRAEVSRPFSSEDLSNFQKPPKLYYPETWFHFIGGNVSKEGIKADLEAIQQAGISGIQWFHGHFGGPWPQVGKQIRALTPEWEEMVGYMGQTAHDLDLRLTVQTCPGWAMAGGPWIKPENAMRDLAWSRVDLEGGQSAGKKLPVPPPSQEEWRDYRDICVLAFPTPLGDSNSFLQPTDVQCEEKQDWANCLLAKLSAPLQLPEGTSRTIEFKVPNGEPIRTFEMTSINNINYHWCYQPDVHLCLIAKTRTGAKEKILDLDLPVSNWQDFHNLELACREVKDVESYQFTISNKHHMSLGFIRFSSAARKNNWRAEAGWTLTEKEMKQQHTLQSPEAFVKAKDIIDVTAYMDRQGNFTWKAPNKAKWTVLRIGHINSGRQNNPAPREATGWECNKFDTRGADAQFNNYVGYLYDGPLKGSLASGMLMDSWECCTQTWTENMENEFSTRTGYKLRQWLPAVIGYVITDQETTSRFLLDWRRTMSDLYNNNFFKRMTDLAHQKGLKVQYETAPADVLPADAMEYYKFADVPMCEFWQPMTDGYVGNTTFKAIKPTASAAHIYGKTRVAAESFTSFSLTWDEHWEMFKDVANYNMIEGVTHNVFHTYTHNPQIGFLPPGTSFGTGIGTPFLRQQTWWKYMPEFTSYLARTSYMLERGIPVVDVLWYLGDEISHRPNQHAPFPDGYKYDYCNPDVLLNRLTVKDNKLVTPEGISYNVIWIPENERMLPETLEKLHQFILEGARVVGNAPVSPATIKDTKQTAKRFKSAVKAIWGKAKQPGVSSIGKGKVATGITIDQALREFGIKPDVQTEGGNVLWSHRQTQGADWYYITAPAKGEFHGSIHVPCKGTPELWDATDGKAYALETTADANGQTFRLDLGHAENAFIVFRQEGTSQVVQRKLPLMGKTIALTQPWTLKFPQGWGAPDSISCANLKPLKDLKLGDEGKAFSGTVSYTTTFNIAEIQPNMNFTLNLGKVDMIADVKVNGKKAGIRWANPYTLYIGDLVKAGTNTLSIDITTTWYNRLAYDAGLPENQRKTWTIAGPAAFSPLRESGLIGPVQIQY